MNKTFVRTNNVKNFIGLVENLVNKPKNIPKMVIKLFQLTTFPMMRDEL